MSVVAVSFMSWMGVGRRRDGLQFPIRRAHVTFTSAVPVQIRRLLHMGKYKLLMSRLQLVSKGEFQAIACCVANTTKHRLFCIIFTILEKEDWISSVCAITA